MKSSPNLFSTVIIMAAVFAHAGNDLSAPYGLSGIKNASVPGYDSIKIDGDREISNDSFPRTLADSTVSRRDTIRLEGADTSLSIREKGEAAVNRHDTTTGVASSGAKGACGTLGGNLPKTIPACGAPYMVIADIYVPSGKTVTIEPGVVLLFKNFTGLHVEGRLVAEGTIERPIVFSSEFDQTYNSSAALHANPFDWNGIYIHESGLGTSMAYGKVLYSVYGVNSLTKYIRLNAMTLCGNGRSDLIIEGKRQPVVTGQCTYVLTLDDARKDGVPVSVLMDPRAKKRAVFKLGGLTLLTGGCVMAVWAGIQLSHDQSRLSGLSTTDAKDPNGSLFKNTGNDWKNAQIARDLDRTLTTVGILCALIGGAGFGLSFTF